MPEQYVLQAEGARASLSALLARKIHRTFPGYLCLKETATREGRLDNLQPKFARFFQRYLAVGDASPQRPFVIPFQDAGAQSRWLNKNVAGSYAKTSLREGTSPLLKVSSIFGERTAQRYTLKNDHASVALEAFLHGDRLPVAPLALFLFRDFALEPEAEGELPSVAVVVRTFRERFGFADTNANQAEDFKTLFVDTGFDESLIKFEKVASK